ncbi:hypothetical protein IPA_07325 [Ignicoccus pacificus DSM 13166]|uniref:Cysteine-rich domain-containing protein n=1 Tax=Ignicoccus pacificus DSM 13166 TaxID=940294 RepID=A0A977PL48_9CREN|nr:hypothetical protein IPA_07325 [Ignicoccus pacificus DSM 13166]
MLCYYPGCSAKGIGKDMDEAVKAVAEKLGIDYKEIEGWSCCGAGVVDDASPLGAAILAHGNMALAKEQRCDKVFTACGICFFQFMKWKGKVKQNEALKEKVEEALKSHFLEPADVEVLHFIELLAEKLTDDDIVRPLPYLKVAIYPGCQAKRGLAAKGKNAFKLMEDILKKLQVEIGPRIDFCCGFPSSTYDKRNSKKMAEEVVRRSLDADVIVTLCPFCQYHIDTTVKGKPIVHLHQLVGLALGIEPEKLGLHRHNNKLEI